MVRIKDYTGNVNGKFPLHAISVYFPGVKKDILDYNRELTEFQVFGIIPSRYMDGFWIGSAENPGLSYYDYKKDRVTPITGDTKLLQRVHTVSYTHLDVYKRQRLLLFSSCNESVFLSAV